MPVGVLWSFAIWGSGKIATIHTDYVQTLGLLTKLEKDPGSVVKATGISSHEFTLIEYRRQFSLPEARHSGTGVDWIYAREETGHPAYSRR